MKALLPGLTVALTICLVGTPAAAQQSSASLTELVESGQLKNGTRVVVETDGARIKGEIRQVWDGTLRLTTKAGPLDVAEADIDRIVKRDSLENGTLIGLGVGFGVAYAASKSMCTNDPECSAAVGVYIGLPAMASGAVGGALIDLAIKKTLYSGHSRGTTLAVAPIVSATRHGAMVSLEF